MKKWRCISNNLEVRVDREGDAWVDTKPVYYQEKVPTIRSHGPRWILRVLEYGEESNTFTQTDLSLKEAEELIGLLQAGIRRYLEKVQKAEEEYRDVWSEQGGKK